MKDEMTGRVNIVQGKKVKNEVTGTKKRCFWLIYLKTFQKFTFLGPITSILTFLKSAADYIDPSGYFVFYEILCSSNF